MPLHFYRVGGTWVLSLRLGRGLIHLGSFRWWRPWVELPSAVVSTIRALRRVKGGE